LSLNYIVYASGITATSYIITGLTPGTRYSIVLQSRNLVGLSAYSNPVSIIA